MLRLVGPTTMRLPVAAVLSSLVASTLPFLSCAINSKNTSAFLVPANGNVQPRATTSFRTNSSISSSQASLMADPKYPGTAVERLTNVHKRVKELADNSAALNGPWEQVRRKILWAGGLKDLPDARPGQVSINTKLHCK